MSILKSPLLIFGILLILLAGALGFGPLFVNWNTYKQDFQREASLVTGRQVVINGPVSVRLFPWPRLTAADVRISNPVGAMVADLVRVELVEAEIAAAPLLSGTIELRKMKLVRPVISLERLVTGGVSWKINPAISLNGLPGAQQIAIAGIEIIDGQVFIGDGRRGGLSELNKVQGKLKAPNLDGPWRADISAEQSGSPIELTVSTSKYREGEPLKVSASITPSGDNGFLWSFDGEALRPDNTVTGRITVQPARQSSGKANPLNSTWQMRLTSDVTADFDTVKLDNIELAPANDLSGGNLVTGSASIKLGQQFNATAKLDAAQIDLDAIMGKGWFSDLDGNARLVAVSDFFKAMPADSSLSFDIGVTSVIAGGQRLSRARLTGQASPQSTQITNISATLPGQTKLSFSGLVLPAGPDGLTQLAGQITTDSASLRELVSWTLPQHAKSISEQWTGARGRARLKAQLGWTPKAFRLTDIAASLDDANATGSFHINQGETPNLNLRLVADSINIDRYAPNGFSTSATKAGTLAGLVDLAATAIAFGDTQITLQADSLLMRAVESRDIAVDIDVSEGSVELRTVQIGGIGDARLDITGIVNFLDEGVSGSVSAGIKSRDPRPFLKLTGLLDESVLNNAWASKLGPIDLKMLSEISTDNDRNKFTLSANGLAAGAQVAVTSSFDGKFAQWRDGDLQLTASATDAQSANMLALFGVVPLSGGEDPAALKLAFAGKPSTALSGSANLSVLSGDIGFAGGLTIDPDDAFGAAGTLTMQSDNATSFMQAMGIAVPDWSQSVSRKLDATADAIFSKNNLKLENLKATLPLNQLSGDITLSGSVRQPLLDGTIKIKHLDLPYFAAMLTLPASASETGSAAVFDFSKLQWLNQKLALEVERMNITPGLPLANGKVEIDRSSPQKFNIVVHGTTGTGDPFTFSTSTMIEGKVMKASGDIKTTVPLGQLLQFVDGESAASGNASLELEFAGAGRSPGGLISLLTGTGKAEISNLSLARFDLTNLVDRVNAMETVERLDDTITAALVATQEVEATGPIDLSLVNGSLRSQDIQIKTTSASGVIRLATDMTTGRTRIDTRLKPDGSLPAVSMRLTGYRLALGHEYNTTALKSHISNAVLQKGLDQLEELQREEKRLIEEEEKFRAEQAAIEAERQRRILVARHKLETERRHAGEEIERQKSALDARRRETELEQQKLQGLILQNLPGSIPQDAIIKPQNSGIKLITPQLQGGSTN
ncbi:MAG: AsmA family protein [Anderseniella sp.]